MQFLCSVCSSSSDYACPPFFDRVSRDWTGLQVQKELQAVMEQRCVSGTQMEQS